MKKIVTGNREDGTFVIEKPKPCKFQIRNEMSYSLERMCELEGIISKGKEAEVELSKLESQFKRLCEIEMEGED